LGRISAPGASAEAGARSRVGRDLISQEEEDEGFREVDETMRGEPEGSVGCGCSFGEMCVKPKQDHAALGEAVRAGRVEAVEGV
jgi:hypothetical protein